MNNIYIVSKPRFPTHTFLVRKPRFPTNAVNLSFYYHYGKDLYIILLKQCLCNIFNFKILSILKLNYFGFNN
jgi:hypothetical protein